MDIATRNSILEILPNELIAKILAALDYRDLASCTQVRFLQFFRKSAPRSSIRVPARWATSSAARCANAFSI